MLRLTQLDDVLFPVQKHTPFAPINSAAGKRRLVAPDKKVAKHRVLGRRIRSYRLITDREWLNCAYQCWQAAFPRTRRDKATSLSVGFVASLMIVMIEVAFAGSASVNGTVDCSKHDSFCLLAGMRIDGEIDDSSVDGARKLLNELHAMADREKKQVHPFSVELDSSGGNVAAALALGTLLRRQNIGATISGAFPPHRPGICISACALIFAGAVHRSFNENAAKLGIHRPYLDIPPQEISTNKAETIYRHALQSVRAYLAAMNVSERLAEAMFRIDPEKVRFLNEKAAVSYGLTEWDPVYKEMSDLQEAREFGLDRREFMNRRVRALKDCEWLSPYDDAPRDKWLSCYIGVMTNTRRAPLPPPGSFGLSDYRVDPGDWSTRADPIDWRRFPRRFIPR